MADALDEAHGHLESALSSARGQEVRSKLEDVIEQFEQMQAKSHGPDAGRIGRLSNAIREAREQADGTQTSVALDRARMALRSYDP